MNKTTNSIRNFARICILAIGSALTTVTALAANPVDYDLPAVGGYDLVSYHQESGPVRGTGFQAAQYKGITYLFANEENKAAFEADPKNYLPAYNGFCAYGLALGKKFHSNPTVYEIIDGTLYLNLDTEIQKKWSSDLRANIRKADSNWRSINQTK